MPGGPSITEVVVWALPLLLWPFSGIVIASWLRRHGRFDAHVPEDDIDRSNLNRRRTGTIMDYTEGSPLEGRAVFYGCLALLAGPLLLLWWLLPQKR